jgi:CubicO group peptidase (beta-lactamase class C family)
MTKIKFLMKAAVIGFLTFTLSIPQTTAQVDGISEDPDVQGQIRLFSAWLESKIAYRGLPGVAVGVVYGEELVWSQGFGLADVATK